MSSHMTAPWDAGVFAAALAAELITSSKDAVVITPKIEFALVPDSYLESIGEMLEGAEWIRTQTLSGLLREHAPDTRPILLRTDAGAPNGYVEESLLEDLRGAHAVVTDLAEIADATRAPVEKAHRLLFVAESRWWSRPQTSPREATIGLEFAEEARALAQGELDKVRLVEVGPTRIVGNEGGVVLAVQNDAGYPVTVDLRLEGNGVALLGSESMEVELAPGRTEVPLQVVKAEGSHTLEVTVFAGESTLDTASLSMSFLTLTTVLPWAILALVIVATGAFLAVRRLRDRRSARAA
jgi:hypothetical protein